MSMQRTFTVCYTFCALQCDHTIVPEPGQVQSISDNAFKFELGGLG